MVPLSQGSPRTDNWSSVEQARARIESRLATLRSEYEKGQIQLQLVQAQLTDVQQTLLRLSGAITVLEELLRTFATSSSDLDHPPTSESPSQVPSDTETAPLAPRPLKEAKRGSNELAADRK